MMKKLAISALTTTLVIGSQVQAAMDPYVEKALQDVCHSATSNRVAALRETIKAYRLEVEDVANKVVCNGLPIAEFAAEHNSDTIAQYLNQRLDSGQVLAMN
ncbi:DUF3718 domain-containing protein [Neiella sp. HB171785]|uniref:DUF3718 domain-containing protein n=1 Tax=Neiella litorisoli TaxID=2771431 RepID=A0A8J6QK16_9GAMM|nr:DUF3718 domain-containing protein [Neiella litorisoli]MBD1390668.1 DUF3718 domain-containing protein [Neiella litorisoli]